MPFEDHICEASDWPVVWAGGDGGGDGASRTNENARFDETCASITNQNARFTVTLNKQHPISNDVAPPPPPVGSRCRGRCRQSDRGVRIFEWTD